MAELVDAGASKTPAARRESSSLSLRILPVGVMVAQGSLKPLVFVRTEYRQLNLSCLVTEWSKVADCNSAVDKIPVAGSNPADSSKSGVVHEWLMWAPC